MTRWRLAVTRRTHADGMLLHPHPAAQPQPSCGGRHSRALSFTILAHDLETNSLAPRRGGASLPHRGGRGGRGGSHVSVHRTLPKVHQLRVRVGKRREHRDVGLGADQDLAARQEQRVYQHLTPLALTLRPRGRLSQSQALRDARHEAGDC